MTSNAETGTILFNYWLLLMMMSVVFYFLWSLFNGK